MSGSCDTELPAAPRGPWWRGARGEWYLVVQAGLFALVAFGPATLPGMPAWPPTLAKTAFVGGVVLIVAGGVFAVAGLVRLGDSLTALPYPRDCSRLETGWPYSVVRHPIYSGLIMGALGLALVRAGWLSLIYAVALFVFFDVKSRTEERWLTQKYPEYAGYRQRVRKLIPWVY